MNQAIVIQKNSILSIFFFFIIYLLIVPHDAYCTYLGLGAQYSYSYLNYKILRDDFYDFEQEEYEYEYSELAALGIQDGVTTRSKDYGLCIIVDDGEEFEELGLFQLRLEYNCFTIPFDNVHNTIKGIRYGLSINIGLNILNLESNIIYAAFTTGAYQSIGKSSINKSEYYVYEVPIGIIIGEKIALSRNSAIVISGTYNFYNHFINNSIYLLGGTNVAGSSMLNFITRRNEFIINCSYVYQFGKIYY